MKDYLNRYLNGIIAGIITVILLVVLIYTHEPYMPKPCIKQKFHEADKAIFIKTNEPVRIIGAWRSLMSSSCSFTGDYTVRFNDGSEIVVKQDALTEEK